jgi:hypothetical protein
VPVHAASSDREVASPVSGGWGTVVLQRRAAPPLRFTGRLVCAADDAGLWIRIWEVRSGGFVLSCSLENGHAVDRHATAEDVMAAVEAFCGGLDRPGDDRVPSRLHLADLLEEVARLALWRQRFRALAGQALDMFDAWCARPRPGTAKEHP